MKLSYNSIFFKFYCFFFAKKVGEDEYGNSYFVKKGNSPKNNSRERRFVIYKGIVEASKVPQRWNAWLHHADDDYPEENILKPNWIKNHTPNLTGSPYSYEYKENPKKEKVGDNQSIWQPDE